MLYETSPFSLRVQTKMVLFVHNEGFLLTSLVGGNGTVLVYPLVFSFYGQGQDCKGMAYWQATR